MYKEKIKPHKNFMIAICNPTMYKEKKEAPSVTINMIAICNLNQLWINWVNKVAKIFGILNQGGMSRG